jgi:hypothetical protein
MKVKAPADLKWKKVTKATKFKVREKIIVKDRYGDYLIVQLMQSYPDHNGDTDFYWQDYCTGNTPNRDDFFYYASLEKESK